MRKSFNVREKEANGEMSGFFTYDEIPEQLLNQIILEFFDMDEYLEEKEYPAFTYQGSFGSENYELKIYSEIVKKLRKEFGIFELYGSNNYKDEFFGYIKNESNIRHFITALEEAFRHIMSQLVDEDDKITIRNSLEEINMRFRQHEIGYQFSFETLEFYKIDSQFIYEQTMIPAMNLMIGKKYDSAQKSFTDAFSDYNDGKYSASIAWSYKAIESLLLNICEDCGWKSTSGKNLGALLKILCEKGVIGNEKKNSIEKDTVGRHKEVHGELKISSEINYYEAAHTLHLTAANIVFLVKASENILKN